MQDAASDLDVIAMELIAIQVMNGIANGMIFFLIAVGLSVVFGIMHFLNVAHGSLYLLGAYLCHATAEATGSLLLGMLVGPAVLALGAWLAQPLLRKFLVLTPTFQILGTLGVALVIQEVVVMIWGTVGRPVMPPEWLAGSLPVGPIEYPAYRLFVIAVTAALAAVLWCLLERTSYGAVLRAGTESRSMISLLGVNVDKVFGLTFALGAALAGLAGALAAPIRGIEPFMAVDALAIAFVVVVIGGIGSFHGALVAALLVGLVQSLMTLVWPLGANLMIYVAMAAIILLRPRGLMGRA